MEPKKNENDKKKVDPAVRHTENPDTRAAHEQADEDISNDPDLSIHSPNDDLDEGETARLGEDKTDLV